MFLYCEFPHHELKRHIKSYTTNKEKFFFVKFKVIKLKFDIVSFNGHAILASIYNSPFIGQLSAAVWSRCHEGVFCWLKVKLDVSVMSDR